MIVNPGRSVVESAGLFTGETWLELWECLSAGFRHSRNSFARAVLQRCLSTEKGLEEVLVAQCRLGEGRAVQVVLRACCAAELIR